MAASWNHFSGKRKYLWGLILLSFITVICVAFTMAGNDDYDIARREVLLRRIGHEILLQSGDSTSRVLPVKKISENEYQVSFENDLTFQPDLLVNTTQRLLAKDPLASDYVVNVLNCANATVTYGYAISRNKKDDIVACIGRTQPIACYTINIEFKPRTIITAKDGYLVGGFSFLAFVGFIVFRYAKPKKYVNGSQDTEVFALGSMSFHTDTRKLITNARLPASAGSDWNDEDGQGNTIDLTKTETRVLRIFALSPNVVIERSRLQKEIWEDEGVIVGRSLDMFISKLRKKLEFDLNVKIVVIRSKGYKLEIDS